MRFIFLDLDDTILDFHRAERQALSQTLRHFHVDPTDAVLDRYHVLNRRQWELLEEGKLTRPQVLVRRFQLLFDELGIRAAPQEVCQLYEEQLAQGHFFVPGAQELLEALHTRYELYLATNGTPEVQNSRIESAGIARYFQNIFISEQMGAYKPSPAFFHACFAAIPDFDAAEAMMVVSEMGEQWSPQTAPAMQAETQTTPCGSVSGKTSSTMGMSMPKVPQLVPVEKAMKQPMRNTMAGSRALKLSAEARSVVSTKAVAPSESVMALRLQAKVRMSMAGTMALKPSGMHSIICLKLMARRSP